MKTTKKETFKYAWRRLIFYIYFFALIVYVQKYPALLEGVLTWGHVILVLWFELNLALEHNGLLVRILHPFCFISAFLDATFVVCLLIFPEDQWIATRSDFFKVSWTTTWIMVIWINLLPAFLVTMDLYLHRGTLIQRHNLVLPAVGHAQTSRVALQIIWIALCCPMLYSLWFLLGLTDIDVSSIKPDQYWLIVPLFVFIDIVISIILVLVLRKPSISQIQSLLSARDFDNYGHADLT